MARAPAGVIRIVRFKQSLGFMVLATRVCKYVACLRDGRVRGWIFPVWDKTC